MGRNKHLKLAEVDGLPNVFPFREGNVEEKIRDFFGNDKPMVLEIGCGDGHYSRKLAVKYPDRNYIGIDIRGARIWNAATKAERDGLKNVAFIIARAEFIVDMFPTFRFEEIWIPFPDPFPKKRNKNRRLVAPGFLERYRKIISPNAIINLKTDDDGLYEYALETLNEENVKILMNTDDLYSLSTDTLEDNIITKYEKQHLKNGKKIKLIKFRLD